MGTPHLWSNLSLIKQNEATRPLVQEEQQKTAGREGVLKTFIGRKRGAYHQDELFQSSQVAGAFFIAPFQFFSPILTRCRPVLIRFVVGSVQPYPRRETC